MTTAGKQQELTVDKQQEFFFVLPLVKHSCSAILNKGTLR